MEKPIYLRKWELLKSLKGKVAFEKQNKIIDFYHYTSLPVLFSILDGNSLWASNVRFSNDAMEERLFDYDNLEKRDDYIICFCAEEDVLSQWRGYCHDGGAAIHFSFLGPQTYSILHYDYEQTGKYELYDNCPQPVLYVNPLTIKNQMYTRIQDSINSMEMNDILKVEDIIPYIKHSSFYEEKELRLVFSGNNGNLSKCIRFRTLDNGVKVPYIIVRPGNIGKMMGTCTTDITLFNDGFIKQKFENMEHIYIDEGNNQEEIYYDVMERIHSYIARHDPYKRIKVFCHGQLPIDKIIVSPTYDRERKKEEIKRFCMSKYWLNEVDVKVSQIPFVKTSL